MDRVKRIIGRLLLVLFYLGVLGIAFYGYIDGRNNMYRLCDSNNIQVIRGLSNTLEHDYDHWFTDAGFFSVGSHMTVAYLDDTLIIAIDEFNASCMLPVENVTERGINYIEFTDPRSGIMKNMTHDYSFVVKMNSR